MPPEVDGQGKLGLGFENPVQTPEVRQFDPDARLAVSSMIKYLAEARGINPDSVTQREFESLTPEKIQDGLYVPEGFRDKDYPRARNGVIFPPEEFAVLAISPIRIARKAGNDYARKNSSLLDKDRIAEGEKRESAKALDAMIDKTVNLTGSLESQEVLLDKIVGELMGARGTGYFAHMKGMDLKLKVIEAELSIRKALEVSAQTKGWPRQKLERAYATLNYQLFGPHSQRFKYWKQYAPVAKNYAATRRRVVELSLGALQKERANFPDYEK